mmetsp:Transcript_20139/g.26718  ORF Transcript_20139/g.26718 Transcript_20139/m.26718 type:complete len:93 (+) Transcript_20139:46-324(+)
MLPEQRATLNTSLAALGISQLEAVYCNQLAPFPLPCVHFLNLSCRIGFVHGSTLPYLFLSSLLSVRKLQMPLLLLCVRLVLSRECEFWLMST